MTAPALKRDDDRAPLVITIDPVLIHSNRRQFKQRVLDELAAGRKAIVIDCSKTQYIDAAGLGVLVSLYRSARLNSAQIVIANLNEDMRSLFETTQLDKSLTLADTVGAAIARLGGER